MSEVCPNCGEIRSVRVHGHDQCRVCGCVLAPCCDGDCAALPPKLRAASRIGRCVWIGVFVCAVALVLNACSHTPKRAATRPATNVPARVAADSSASPSSTPQASSDGADAQPELAPLPPEESYARGVEFLVKNQNEDGSWGSFVSLRTREIYLDNLSSHHAFHDATTALCLLALLEPSKHDDAALAAVRRAIQYAIKSRPAGRASGGTFYDTWTHTYLIQALSQVLMDARFTADHEQVAEIARREIALLAERQALEGGFGYYDFKYTLKSPSGDQSTSFNTAAALIALLDAKAAGLDVPQAMVDSGLAALQRLRLPSGAYIYGEYARNNPAAGYNKVKGSLGRSQSCNLALWFYRDQIKQPITREELLKGAEALRDEHHFIEIGRGRPVPHEAWYFTAGYYYLFGHYYLARVINELTTTDRESLGPWLIANMTAIQDPGGSWTDFPLYGYHRCYGAAFGLLTLQECGVGLASRGRAQTVGG